MSDGRGLATFFQVLGVLFTVIGALVSLFALVTFLGAVGKGLPDTVLLAYLPYVGAVLGGLPWFFAAGVLTLLADIRDRLASAARDHSPAVTR